MNKQRIRIVIFTTISVLLLAACGDDGAAPTVAPAADLGDAAAPAAESDPTAEPTPVTTAVPTPIPPTPTPSEPLAATVNGEPIFLATYEKELARYEQSQAELSNTEDAGNDREIVLNALIERELIAQAAADAGITVTDADVDAKLAELRTAAGENGNFAAWLETNQWTEEEFRQALAREMLTEQMVAQVTADVPVAVEQVRARYIQVADAALADSLLAQLQSGADFAALAAQHSLDQVTGQNGGDLGFFARGSLLVPALEEAAFALQPNELSSVIAAPNESGEMRYYILQVTERDPQRPLPAELRYERLQATFETWLDTLRQTADIERLVNTDA